MDTTLDIILNGSLPMDFNWNSAQHRLAPIINTYRIDPDPKQVKNIHFVAEDLRDGLHGITHYPSVENMERYIDSLVDFGFRYITTGIYSGKTGVIGKSVNRMLKYIHTHHPQVTPILVALTTEDSLTWLDECRKYNPHIEVLIFMGTSPTRQLVEEWDRNKILHNLGHAIKTIVHDLGLKALATPEQATQTDPEFLQEIIGISVKNGAQRMCIADTIGTARPIGTIRIMEFFKKTIHKFNANLPIDWHGHDDLGNGPSNAMAAIASGAARIHTVARGVGERAGNTRLEAVILNCTDILTEAGIPLPWNINKLTSLLNNYDALVQLPPPSHGPVSKRAYKTSLGIHTSAMLKADKLAKEAVKHNKPELAKRLMYLSQRIYCAVDANRIGSNVEIFVGPFSGKSTVQLALSNIGIKPGSIPEEVVQSIITMAKELGRELTHEELKNTIAPYTPNGH